MEDIEKSIIAAKAFLYDDKCKDSRCSRVWFGATENIKEYFELLKWKETKKVLSVCSSGDHILNLINKGVKEIDTFDINPLTFPYLNLRIACILAMSYEEYFKYFEKLSIASCSEYQEYEMFSAIKPFISPPYDYFWEELYSENLKKNKHNVMESGLLGKYCEHYIPFRTSVLRNQWLSNKNEYEKTKHNLRDSNINFKCINLLDVPHNFLGDYDKILLSNISDYLISPLTNLDNNNFHMFIINELASMLTTNGEILASYIYRYIDNGEFRGIHFKNSCNSNYSMFENEYQMLEVHNIDDCGSIEYGSRDAVLVYKKK